MSTLGKKEARINLKINPNLREEFQAAAHLRGASMSGILHQYIVKVVRDEKERSPEQFDKALEFVRQAGPDEEGKMEMSPAEFAAAEREINKGRTNQPGDRSGRNSGTKNR